MEVAKKLGWRSIREGLENMSAPEYLLWCTEVKHDFGMTQRAQEIVEAEKQEAEHAEVQARAAENRM